MSFYTPLNLFSLIEHPHRFLYTEQIRWESNKNTLTNNTGENVLLPDNTTAEEADKVYFQSRFGSPDVLKRFTHELSTCFLEINDKDLREITLSFNNAQGNLSFGISRHSKPMQYFANVFEGIKYDQVYDTQPICVYYACRGRFCAFSLEYYGCLETFPPLLGSIDARFKQRTRFQITLLKLARNAIHKTRANSFLAQVFKFVDEADSARYTRDYFIPQLSNVMTECQALYMFSLDPDSPINYLLNYPGTLIEEDWEEMKLMWARIKATPPFLRWKKKDPLREIVRELSAIQTHYNHPGLLRFLSFGLFNFRLPQHFCSHDQCLTQQRCIHNSD